MAITLARIKSKLYTNIDSADYDTELQELITSLSASAIEFLDNPDITTAADFTSTIERKLCVQIAYEFRRRHDAGLSSVSYPDGSVSKYEIGEWLPDVKNALLRKRVITI